MIFFVPMILFSLLLEDEPNNLWFFRFNTWGVFFPRSMILAKVSSEKSHDADLNDVLLVDYASKTISQKNKWCYLQYV